MEGLIELFDTKNHNTILYSNSFVPLETPNLFLWKFLKICAISAQFYFEDYGPKHNLQFISRIHLCSRIWKDTASYKWWVAVIVPNDLSNLVEDVGQVPMQTIFKYKYSTKKKTHVANSSKTSSWDSNISLTYCVLYHILQSKIWQGISSVCWSENKFTLKFLICLEFLK